MSFFRDDDGAGDGGAAVRSVREATDNRARSITPRSRRVPSSLSFYARDAPARARSAERERISWEPPQRRACRAYREVCSFQIIFSALFLFFFLSFARFRARTRARFVSRERDATTPERYVLNVGDNYVITLRR